MRYSSGAAALVMLLGLGTGDWGLGTAHPDIPRKFPSPQSPVPSPTVRLVRYPNGHPAESRRYVNGVEEGPHRGWWKSGTPKFDFTYRRGVMEGEAREWYPDGRPYRDFHYAAGHEEGSQRMWWPDGRIRASYVVRDGRRYGLMGSKGCVTDDDSTSASAR